MTRTMILRTICIIIAIIFVVFSLSLVELYTQLSRYRSFWQQNNTAQLAKSSGRLYIALGDSTAQGIGATSPMRSYVGVIAKELEKREPIKLVNLSKSGGKVQDVIDEQIPVLRDLPIDNRSVITMQIGANNMINFDAKSFEQQMDKLMTQLPPQTVISDIPYFGESRFKSRENNVKTANEIMYRLAAKHDFELAPLHSKMQANGGIKTFAVDWFHPSNTAYRENWAPVFLEKIDR